MSLGKWILGGLGFVVGGPIGALVGIMIASAFEATTYADMDNSKSRHKGGGYKRATQGDIRVSIIVLIACVIKSDGQVLKSEINYVKPFFLRTFGEQGAKQALHLLKELLEKDLDHIAIAQQIGQCVNYSTRLELLNLLLSVANSDGSFAEQELHVIEQIAHHMSVQYSDFQSLLNSIKSLENRLGNIEKSLREFSSKIQAQDRIIAGISEKEKNYEETGDEFAIETWVTDEYYITYDLLNHINLNKQQVHTQFFVLLVKKLVGYHVLF